MSNLRRQKEQEQKIIEEETTKRIEEMVAQRVAEELEKRKDEIEAEVLRRVEEAKQIMEQQMLQELERRRKERLEEEKRREVPYSAFQSAPASISFYFCSSFFSLIYLFIFLFFYRHSTPFYFFFIPHWYLNIINLQKKIPIYFSSSPTTRRAHLATFS